MKLKFSLVLLLLIFGASQMLKAQKSIQLFAAESFMEHEGYLEDLMPSLTEGLFMRYPPPQDSILEQRFRVKVTALSCKNGRIPSSHNELQKMLESNKGELRYSSSFRLNPKGTKRQALPIMDLEPFSFLRKRPGRKKFQAFVIPDARHFDQKRMPKLQEEMECMQLMFQIMTAESRKMHEQAMMILVNLP